MIPRIAYVHCLGLPLKLWNAQNINYLSNSFGELLEVTPLLDAELNISNPILKVATLQQEKINFRQEIILEEKVFAISCKEEKSFRNEWEFLDVADIDSNFNDDNKNSDMDQELRLDDSEMLTENDGASPKMSLGNDLERVEVEGDKVHVFEKLPETDIVSNNPPNISSHSACENPNDLVSKEIVVLNTSVWKFREKNRVRSLQKSRKYQMR